MRGQRYMGVKLPPFQRLLDEHRNDVHRFLVASAGPDDVDDCFQETFTAARDVVDRATADGLVDLTYAIVPSPVGELATVCSRKGLMCLSYDAERIDSLLDTLAEHVSPRILESRSRIDAVERQLDEYFA